MDIIITTKNLTLDEATRAQVVRRFDKLGRHVPTARELRLDLFEEATKSADDRFVARGFLDILGPVMTSECRATSLITAVDQLVAVLDRQVKDFKTKNLDFHDRGAQRFESAEYTLSEPEPPILSPDSDFQIDKEKVVALPMSLPEAVQFLNESTEDSIIFRNSRGGLSLLRRQPSAGYKLVEIE